jgi:hypothetical protein
LFAIDLLAGGYLDVVGDSKLLQEPDHTGAEIDLALSDPVNCRSREGVVIVVPRLAERDERKKPVVRTEVLRLVGTLTVEVTD